MVAWGHTFADPDMCPIMPNLLFFMATSQWSLAGMQNFISR